MKIQCENGLYTAVANDGKVISFEDRDEAVACAKLHCGIMRLLGHDVSVEDYIPSEKKATPAPVTMQKKSVRIRIDTDVEFLGNKKALA